MIRKIVRDLEKLTRAEAIAEFALLKGWTVCGFSNDAFDPGGDKDRVIVSIPKPDAAVESHCAFVGRMKDYINRPIIHFVFHPKACAIEYCTTVEEVTDEDKGMFSATDLSWAALLAGIAALREDA